MTEKHDIDPQETQEWLDALDAVIANVGLERAHFLIEKLIDSFQGKIVFSVDDGGADMHIS